MQGEAAGSSGGAVSKKTLPRTNTQSGVAVLVSVTGVIKEGKLLTTRVLRKVDLGLMVTVIAITEVVMERSLHLRSPFSIADNGYRCFLD
jgi:hypothetical protein